MSKDIIAAFTYNMFMIPVKRKVMFLMLISIIGAATHAQGEKNRAQPFSVCVCTYS